MTKQKVGLVGANGRMGNEIKKILDKDEKLSFFQGMDRQGEGNVNSVGEIASSCSQPGIDCLRISILFNAANTFSRGALMRISSAISMLSPWPPVFSSTRYPDVSVVR